MAQELGVMAARRRERPNPVRTPRPQSADCAPAGSFSRCRGRQPGSWRCLRRSRPDLMAADLRSPVPPPSSPSLSPFLRSRTRFVLVLRFSVRLFLFFLLFLYLFLFFLFFSFFFF